jgi:type II secretory pathway pseudopilin PulG
MNPLVVAIGEPLEFPGFSIRRRRRPGCARKLQSPFSGVTTMQSWNAGRRGILDDRGLSLVELIIAFLVLGIASVGLLQLSSAAIGGNVRGKDHAAAVALATARIEELKSLGFERLSDLSSEGPGSDGPMTAAGEETPTGIFQRTWSVTSGTLNDRPSMELEVIVSWTGGGSVTLRTAVTDARRDFRGQPGAYVSSWDQLR